MIFATDLDRTMIYSRKFLNDENIKNVSLIETLEGKDISYMSNNAMKELEELNKKIYVIPVTTRSITQFKRINNFKYCEYAITTNGGTILHNGEVLEDWENYIANIVKPYEEKNQTIMELLKNKSFIIKEPRLVDSIFIFTKTDDVEKCEEFLDNNIDKNIWNYTIQGQKVYIIPKEITKSNALKYLKEKLNVKTVIAAGDGKLDKDMLEYANYAILPKHGELYELGNVQNKNLTIVDNGVFTSDEIIKKIREYMKEGEKSNEL